MAAWTPIDTDNLLPGEPWTSAKANAVYENPTAMAEGASGAPTVEVAWHELEELTLGSDGTTITFATDTSAYRALRIVGGCSVVVATDPQVNIRLNVGGFTTVASASYTGTTPTAFMIDATIDNADSTAAGSQKIVSGMVMAWDRVTSTSDWDTTAPTSTPVPVMGVKKTASVVSAVQLGFSADVDVSEGSPTFRLYGIKRTQP